MTQSVFLKPSIIKFLLVLGIIPLVLFPAATFNVKSQEWWLPAILVVLAIIGIVQIIRKSTAQWPMFIVAFSHGFNIISRLLMLMPQSTIDVNGVTVVNSTYLIMTVISMVISTAFLWFVELPEVKQQLAQ